MTADNPQDKLNEFFTYVAQYSGTYPDIARAFMELQGSVMADGKVDAKTKELIAIGIAVSLRCLPCIYAHTKGALTQGAKPEEIMEAASVAVLMSGGPGMVHVAEVMKAIEAFQKNV
ncbi:MAG: carboxymuconolactone decarboxylase family protein [Proteobacteria bacterium]|nr:carboxymuconolactone decarboxylase family protein [Pseudomonadota bacterium]